MTRAISIRPECQQDNDFLASLYASTRQSELAMLGWSAAEQAAFLTMQFDAQSRHYRTAFPAASHSIICVDGELAGRLIVDRRDDEVHIVDVALLPEFRGAGVGAELIRGLLAEADAAGLPVRCHVLAGNRARRFWERAGFVAQDSGSAYISMERPCATLQRDLATLTAADFEAVAGSDFTVVEPGPDQPRLVLSRVVVLPERPGYRRPFSLRFRGPATSAPTQGIRRLAHDEMGELEIFLVPIAADADSTTYQAVFS
jgi:ribosomal protein S18 acetylase RimI-like enzyme